MRARHALATWQLRSTPSSGQVYQATKYLQQAVALNPRSAICYQALGVALIRAGESSAAESALRHAASLAPSNGHVLHALASCRARQGDAEGAFRIFEEGIASRPADGALYTAYAREVLAGTPDRARGEEAALAVVARGTRAAPSHAPCWQMVGVLEARRGNLSAARRAFQHGIWADPLDRTQVRFSPRAAAVPRVPSAHFAPPPATRPLRRHSSGKPGRSWSTAPAT